VTKTETRPGGAPETPSDEQCMRELAQNRPEALKPLFTRHAPLVFHMALQSLDPGTAEEIVQDVFLSVWRKCQGFDQNRGTFRPWLLQIAHYRILNELRARSRRPALDPDDGGGILEELRDTRNEPAEAAWQAYRKDAVRAAVDRLPPAQRQALSLAFFDDLSHDQVAEALKLPVGTVKTRIRAAVHKLRFLLAPLGVAAVAMVILAGGGIRMGMQRQAALRTDRALSMVTASDITTFHVPPAAGMNPASHGSYRGRPGTPRAVLALHNFVPASAGRTYQAWAKIAGAWTSMGTVDADSAGNALLVAEGNAFTALPSEVEVTVEPRGGSSAQTGTVVIHYPGPRPPNSGGPSTKGRIE
jgi:RNA polymerase sigma-70 factor (ECF subfamily)